MNCNTGDDIAETDGLGGLSSCGLFEVKHPVFAKELPDGVKRHALGCP
jgi:hypothetical protein